jgi:hypothetical protein
MSIFALSNQKRKKMNTKQTFTDSEQFILDLIKTADNDDCGAPYEYENNFVVYSKFTFSEVRELISSLKEKNAIRTMYDFRGGEVFLIN